MSKQEIKKELDSYVPRHMRLGIPKNCQPVFEQFHDVEEEIPVVDKNGKRMQSVHSHKLMKPVDTIGKFKASDFDIDEMQANGVPVEVMNWNRGAIDYEMVESAISKVGSLEELAKRADERQKEFDELFKPVVKNEVVKNEVVENNVES